MQSTTCEAASEKLLYNARSSSLLLCDGPRGVGWGKWEVQEGICTLWLIDVVYESTQHCKNNDLC